MRVLIRYGLAASILVGAVGAGLGAVTAGQARAADPEPHEFNCVVVDGDKIWCSEVIVVKG